MGIDDSSGCSCPSVRNENGEVIGVLTVSPPGAAGPCAGCLDSREDEELTGRTALSRELQRLSNEGWAVVDLKDKSGEFRVRLELPAIVRSLDLGTMPRSVSVQTLASPVMSRITRCGIALLAAPLVLISGAVAMVHVMGLIAPLALIMAPFIVMFLPVIVVGLCADGKLSAEGTVTAIALHHPEHEAEKHQADIGGLLEPLHMAPDFAREPIQMRVRVSSFPGAIPSESGVFVRDLAASTEEVFEGSHEHLAECDPAAVVA